MFFLGYLVVAVLHFVVSFRSMDPGERHLFSIVSIALVALVWVLPYIVELAEELRKDVL